MLKIFHLNFQELFIKITYMEIIKASVMGFCMGVRRAVEAAEKTVQEYGKQNLPMFTLGPLIHNPSVMESLKKNGMTILDNDFSTVTSGCPVVIRAHGTMPQTVQSLEEKGAIIVDATCPRVKQSQNRVAQWSKKGYDLVVAGDKNHGEVTGISGYFDNSMGGSFFVVQSVDDAENLDIKEKTVLIAQTTFSLDEFEKIKNRLLQKNPALVIFNSLCPATKERQKSLEELKDKADGILVIGGKNSANTKRLLETASKFFSHASLIEGPDEIPQEFYGMKKVALTAGASTPDWIIENVEKKLKVHKN